MNLPITMSARTDAPAIHFATGARGISATRIALSSGFLDAMSDLAITLCLIVFTIYVLAGILSSRDDSSVPISSYSSLRFPDSSVVPSG